MVRSQNQDFLFASDQKIGTMQNLFIVADGMGGHNAGEVASELAVNTAVSVVRRKRSKEPVPVLQDAFVEANDAVYEMANGDETLKGMGTTLVACTFRDEHLYVANVGDSRLYVVTGHKIQQITRDHSLVQEMVQQGKLSSDNARLHPKKNYITRAIGADEIVRTDFFDVTIEEGDKVLLCTDGLTNMVPDDTILSIITGEGDPQEKAETLVMAANASGGKDNITVILIDTDDEGE